MCVVGHCPGPLHVLIKASELLAESLTGCLAVARGLSDISREQLVETISKRLAERSHAS